MVTDELTNKVREMKLKKQTYTSDSFMKSCLEELSLLHSFKISVSISKEGKTCLSNFLKLLPVLLKTFLGKCL